MIEAAPAPADGPGLAEIARESGAALAGLILEDGTLILKVERAGRARQVRIADGARFDPWRGSFVPGPSFGRDWPRLNGHVRDLWRMLGGFRYVALRLFNAAGADPALHAGPERRGSPRLVDAACEAAAGLRAGITVFGTGYDTPDGTCVRDYVHVTDAAEAHVAALRSLERGGPSRVLNCGSGRGASVREVLAAVAAQAGAAIESRAGAPRRGDPPALVADTGRIREALGWSPRLGGVDACVATTLRWLRESGWRGCDGGAPQ